MLTAFSFKFALKSARRVSLRGICNFPATDVSQSLLSLGSIEIGADSTPLTAKTKSRVKRN